MVQRDFFWNHSDPTSILLGTYRADEMRLLSETKKGETSMDTPMNTSTASVMDLQSSGVSWAAVAAGATAAAALTLVLIAFGTGIGLSAVSPWSDSGASASTFKIGTGIYLVVVAVMASSVGGYLAARLRTKWIGVHTHEVFFRDTADGFLTWAFATVISASVLGAATTHLVSGAAGGLAAATRKPRNGGPDGYRHRQAPSNGHAHTGSGWGGTGGRPGAG